MFPAFRNFKTPIQAEKWQFFVVLLQKYRMVCILTSIGEMKAVVEEEREFENWDWCFSRPFWHSPDFGIRMEETKWIFPESEFFTKEKKIQISAWKQKNKSLFIENSEMDYRTKSELGPFLTTIWHRGTIKYQS